MWRGRPAARRAAAAGPGSCGNSRPSGSSTPPPSRVRCGRGATNNCSTSRVRSAVGRSSHAAETPTSFGSTVSRTNPAGDTSRRAATRGEPAASATAAPSVLPASTTPSICVTSRTSSSTRPYQASLARGGRRGSLRPGWPGRSTMVVGQCCDSARSHGSAAAALCPVPGRTTILGLSVPAEVRWTFSAVVSTVVVASGKSARPRASEHNCRTELTACVSVHGLHCSGAGGRVVGPGRTHPRGGAGRSAGYDTGSGPGSRRLRQFLPVGVQSGYLGALGGDARLSDHEQVVVDGCLDHLPGWQSGLHADGAGGRAAQQQRPLSTDS